MSHLVFLISFMNVSLLTLNCIGDSLWEYGSVTNILALKFQCPGFVSLIHCVTKQLQSHFKPIPLTDQFFYYSRCPSLQRPVLKLHQTYYISLDFGGVFCLFYYLFYLFSWAFRILWGKIQVITSIAATEGQATQGKVRDLR